MKNLTQAIFETVATFGTMGVGAGIVLIVIYGFTFWTIAFTVGAALVAFGYEYVASINEEEEIEE
jgi:Trk-type K+ transport system membrane component